MATTPRKGQPEVFVTSLSGLASGENQCVWAGWFKAHFRYDKYEDGGFDSAAWSADHDELVRKRAKEFEIDGGKVRLEKQNWMRVPGVTVTLTGKPDIVSELGGLFTIADGKTGPIKKKDWFQGLLYTYMLPMAWANRALRVCAEIFYKTGQRIPISANEFTPELKAHTFGILRRLGDSVEPPRTPSVSDCRVCDILQCPDRMKEQPDDTPLTAEF